MPHNPSTLAFDNVRIPSKTYGVRKGVRLHLDHAQEEFQIIDESAEYFPFIVLPKTVAPEQWLVKESIGWKYEGAELWGYVGGNVFVKISTTAIRFYDNSGTKTFHYDRAKGDIYIKGRVRGDNINMPPD